MSSELPEDKFSPSRKLNFIIAVCAMIVEDKDNQEYPSYHWGDRSVIHGDAVHFIYDHQVWSAHWQTPELLSGPR